MRIRLNTKTDELWIELEGDRPRAERGPDPIPEPTRSVEIPGAQGRGAVVLIDADGYVRLIRIAKLQEMLGEFAPETAKSAKKGAKTT